MSKIIELQELKDKLGTQKLVLKKQYQQLESDRKDKLIKVYYNFFGGVLEEGDIIDSIGGYVYFKRLQEESYSKDILTLNFRWSDWEMKEVNQIETSFYSTTDNSEFELRRMILLGKVGQILMDYTDEILETYNQVVRSTGGELSEVRNKIYKIEDQIKNIKNDISDLEKGEILNKLEDKGITIVLPENKTYKNLPNLQIRFDKNVFRVKELRIISKTPSGKSANIEVKRVREVWDGDSFNYKPVDVIEEYTKVRMENIVGFLRRNREKIEIS